MAVTSAQALAQAQRLSLVIPVYNEIAHLHRFLPLIDSISLPLEKELIIVDDCSTDGSRELLREFSFSSNATVIEQPHNRGKGAAIAVGIRHATGHIIGIQDADFEYSPSDIARIINAMLENGADVCYGSRFKNNRQVHRTFHYLGNRLLTLTSNLFSGLYVTDMETCYKFFKADVIKNIKLQSQRFGFEPEVTAKIARLKVRVEEIPIRYAPRTYQEGKKITWKDGVAALWHIVRFNLFFDDKAAFDAQLPERYHAKGTQWL